MSAKVLSYVLENSKLSGSARLLMAVLADMSNNDGECWPGKASIARRVNVSTRQIIRLTQECERQGELRVLPPAELGGQNHYLIIGIAPDVRVRRARKPRKKLERIRREDVSSDTGVTTDTSVTPLVTPVSPKLSTELSTLKDDAAKTAAVEKPKRAASKRKAKPSTYTPPKPYAETSGLSDTELEAQAAALSKVNPAHKPNTKEAIRRALLDAFGYDPERITKPLEGELGSAVKTLHDAHFTADDIPRIHRYCVAKNWTGGFGFSAVAKHAPAWAAFARLNTPKADTPLSPEPERVLEDRSELLDMIRSRNAKAS